MAISIIMPAYNAEKYLRAAIDSVKSQSYVEWELLVVDDCSTDGTEDIVNSYLDNRVRYIKQESKGGPSAARRRGTNEAKYPLISYFDADDLLRPTALEKLKAGIDARPDAVLVYGDFVRIDESGRRIGIRSYLPSPKRPSGDVLANFLTSNFMPNGGCALVRKSAVLSTQAWESNLRCGGDWVAWTRVAKAGPFEYLRGLVTMEYRELKTGISQTVSTSFENFLPSIEVIYTDQEIVNKFSAEQMVKFRRKRIAHLWFFISSLYIRKGKWLESIRYIINSVSSYPLGAPNILLRYGFALLESVT